MIQGGSSTAQKPKGHVDFKSAFYFQTPVWVAEAPMFLKDTIKLTDKYMWVEGKKNSLGDKKSHGGFVKLLKFGESGSL